MKKTDLKIIRGGREELERKLLRAVFSRDGKKTVADLKKRLARRAKGRLQVVNSASPAEQDSSLLPPDGDGQEDKQ